AFHRLKQGGVEIADRCFRSGRRSRRARGTGEGKQNDGNKASNPTHHGTPSVACHVIGRLPVSSPCALISFFRCGGASRLRLTEPPATASNPQNPGLKRRGCAAAVPAAAPAP